MADGREWVIYWMDIEDSTGELYGVQLDGGHAVSRITKRDAIRYVTDYAADNDTILYSGAKWTGAQWRQGRK